MKKGDIVKLKSGGPKMTLDDIQTTVTPGKKIYYCVWFLDNGVLQRAEFEKAALKVEDT